MVRVLVVTVVHRPLDARIHHRQIGALLAADVQVTYAAPWAATATPPTQAPGLTTVDLPRATGRRRVRALRAARRLLRVEGRRHDLVLLHDPDLLLATVGLRRLPPVVWDVHEDTAGALIDRSWVPARLRRVVACGVRLAERLAARRYHLVLAETAYQERFHAEHPVIRNVPPVPAEAPVPGDDRVVYVGRISRSRGLEEMIALGRLLAPDIEVELVGQVDTDDEPALRRAHDDGAVRWTGFLPNEDALTRVDGALAGLSLLHDLPNYRGSMPTKVLEYLAHGVPAVTTPLPVAAAIVESSGGGVVVPFGDVRAAEAAVRRYAADPAARRAAGAAGRAAVQADHDWHREGRRFVELLRGWAA